jgi:two-component system, NtrC family, response regulator AtoC
MPRILIVDDDSHARDLLTRLLSGLGEVTTAENAPQAIAILESAKGFSLVLTDMAMPDAHNGLEVLKASKEFQPDAPVVVVTAYGNIEGALDTIQQGAFDYLAKPFDVDAIVRVAKRALEQKQLRDENQTLKSQSKPATLVGRSTALLEVFKQVARAAQSDVPVLVTGETGTGKEMVARSLHLRSKRAHKPFIAIDCAAISESLMESELFGHAKGSFTGAVSARRGVFEEAHGGTLFLDEIGDVGPKIQSQLLRVLQEGEIRRVGESTSVKVDVRVVAATNKDLKAAIEQQRFREDLLYRLDVVRLHLPPLRERRDDIAALVEHFAVVHAVGRARPVVTQEAMQQLTAYDWPGNVRQLENVMARALALNASGILTLSDFPPPIGNLVPPSASNLLSEDAPSLDELNRRYAQQVLQKTNGNKSEAARILQVDRKTLYKLLGES